MKAPEREFWLQKNLQALASVVRGVEQAKRGELGTFPSFASFHGDNKPGELEKDKEP